jgi:hypothetical protein
MLELRQPPLQGAISGRTRAVSWLVTPSIGNFAAALRAQYGAFHQLAALYVGSGHGFWQKTSP